MVGAGRIETVWKALDAATTGKGALALEHIDGLVTAGEHPVGLLSAMSASLMKVYHAGTLRRNRVELREACQSAGIPPFAVESTRTYSYLFGNANMLNLAMSGGLDNSPHPATRMYLARVPRGRFDLAPEYRTATGWSRDSEQAVPISSRYSNENTMQPRRFGADKWIAVTKVNGFNGDGVVIDVATRPWGPWRTVQRLDFRTPYDSQITYHPVLMPWRTANGDLTMAIALNGGASWEVALDNPHLYRPGVAEVAWPAS